MRMPCDDSILCTTGLFLRVSVGFTITVELWFLFRHSSVSAAMNQDRVEYRAITEACLWHCPPTSPVTQWDP